jgi:hypothetical protein
MNPRIALRHEFVDLVPDQLEEHTLYVSIKYRTVIHNCCCGCGRQVVTPLSPTGWRLTFDGVSISLNPSIGNWNLPCKSHYWIEDAAVKWARPWSAQEIEAGRAAEALAKAMYYLPTLENPQRRSASTSPADATGSNTIVVQQTPAPRKHTFWRTLTGWLVGRNSKR